jgi:hypothetical protein
MHRLAFLKKCIASARQWWVCLLWLPLIAWAAIVTAQDVANAIRNSPTSTAWMRANADAIGRLAMFESGGNLSVYNGSCCFGILQMNRANIAQTRFTPEQFRNLPLQAQINAWTDVMSSALNASAPRQLMNMGTFNGRPVDASLVLACVQLGIGNCQRMINSGSCAGFADINGTTICSMADRINGTTGTTGTGGSTPTGPPGGGTPVGPGTMNPGPAMTMDEAFQAGSGISPSRLKSLIQALTVAFVLLIMGAITLSLFKGFSNGVYEKVEMVDGMRKVFYIVGIIVFVMTLF